MLVNRIGAGFCRTNTLGPDPMEKNRVFSRLKRRRALPPLTVRPAAFHGVDSAGKEKSMCTADEFHYVPVSGSNWNLALWRYLPSPKATSRNRPLLLLSGVATNAIGYDLSPESSFARYMSSQGFDTWTLEVRGAGLSTHTGVLDVGQNSAISGQIRDLNSRLRDFFEEGKHNLPTQVLDLQDRFTTTLEEFQKQIELIVNYDWDFDHYLEEDVPAAIDYIRTQCKPKDGKMHAIGHSMGGILLYAMLSRCSFEGKDSGLASIVTLASSLDYTPSKSSLKLFLPLAEPAQALNIPIIPIGPLLATAYPLGPPFLLSWLSSHVTAQGLKDEKLLEKLILKNLCTVPSKLLLQLTTAFHKGGLRDRNGSFFYKDHLHKSNVPVLALAGDQDRVCPPEAVYETVKLIPEDLVTYKVFGEPGGPHYSHFDLVGGRLAADELYPIIIKFLVHHD